MNFPIPDDVSNDIIYCQKTMRHYVHVHQMLAVTLSETNMLDDPRLAELQNEIVDIGRDQKRLVDRLRWHMENYFIFLTKQNLSIDRIAANDNVASQLFQSLQMCYDKVEPINVKKRLSDNELMDRYIHKRATTSGSAAAIVPRNNTIVKQKSLLKPKSERLAPHSSKNDSNEQLHSSSSSSSAILKSRRLNLRQVLQAKAAKHSQYLDQGDKNVKEIDNSISSAPPAANKTNEDDDVIFIEATPFEIGKRKTTPTKTDIISISSTSSSSTSSLFDENFDKRDSLDDQRGKEIFLEVFGLCTHSYRDHLIKKRSGRKRRSCTSAAKRDFHYGNIDIIDSQLVRPNKRVFLKSTPVPRTIETKSKRRKSDPVPSSEKPKSETKLTSSSKYDDKKLCILCLNAKNEKILECESCRVYYHLGCHKSDIQSQRIKSQYCTDCLQKQRKAREEMMADLRRK